MATRGFNTQENKKLLYDLTQDLLKTQYKFQKLTHKIIIPEIQHKISEFLNIQHKMIYNQRFNYKNTTEMNKEMLKQINNFLYHLYKQYKAEYKASTPSTPQIQEVYNRNQNHPQENRHGQDTQQYKEERQATIEKIMREKQEDFNSYLIKPKPDISFQDNFEDQPAKMNEIEQFIKQRENEDRRLYNMNSTNGITPPKQETPNSNPKKVSFGVANVKNYDSSKPSEDINPSKRDTINSNPNPNQPSIQAFLGKLKEDSSKDKEDDDTTNRPSNVNSYETKIIIKRLSMYFATSGIRHHFLRLRGERSVQSETTQSSIFVNTILENLPITLEPFQHQWLKEFLITHHYKLWNWWEFFEDLMRDSTFKERKRWIRYIDLDTPFQPERYPLFHGWLDKPMNPISSREMEQLPSSKTE